MGEAEETEKEIEARSNEYRPVAKRASLLYFCLADLAVVSESLHHFPNTTMDDAILTGVQLQSTLILCRGALL